MKIIKDVPSRVTLPTLWVVVWRKADRESDGPSTVHRTREDAVESVHRMRTNSPLGRELEWQEMEAHLIEVSVVGKETL